MFATIAVIAVVLLADVLAFAATKPDSFRVERNAHRSSAREDLSTHQRLSQLGLLVPLRKAGPDNEENSQRPGKR